MFAMKESLALHRCRLFHYGLYQTDRTFGEINAGHSLIDLERSGLSRLRINMVPVVQTKRQVAILLNLEHNKVAAQRVNRACAEENGVTMLRSQTCEVVRHRPVRERSSQIGFSSIWLQARVDAALCPRFQHNPSFGLRGLARWEQVRIRSCGMHLDRKHFMYVEELQQQGESGETPGQLSHYLLRELLQQSADGQPL